MFAAADAALENLPSSLPAGTGHPTPPVFSKGKQKTKQNRECQFAVPKNTSTYLTRTPKSEESHIP